VTWVRTEIRERVALVTLDDPERRNAISLAMSEALVEAFAGIGDSGDVSAVVVTGTPPAFSAGADLTDLEAADRERLRRIYHGFLAVARCPWPTIAAVNGAAVGAGFNLALACDVRIAARSARFDSRFLDLGLHPGGGHTWMLRRLLGPQGAAAVVLLGEALDGEEAARRGLAWRVVDDGEVVDASVRLAARAAAAPPGMVRRLKDTLRRVEAIDEHGAAVELELEPQLWTATQPEFRERLAALKARIARSQRAP
jgi:enoyl-CoA hydratase